MSTRAELSPLFSFVIGCFDTMDALPPSDGAASYEAHVWSMSLRLQMLDDERVFGWVQRPCWDQPFSGQDVQGANLKAPSFVRGSCITLQMNKVEDLRLVISEQELLNSSKKGMAFGVFLGLLENVAETLFT